MIPLHTSHSHLEKKVEDLRAQAPRATLQGSAGFILIKKGAARAKRLPPSFGTTNFPFSSLSFSVLLFFFSSFFFFFFSPMLFGVYGLLNIVYRKKRMSLRVAIVLLSIVYAEKLVRLNGVEKSLSNGI